MNVPVQLQPMLEKYFFFFFRVERRFVFVFGNYVGYLYLDILRNVLAQLTICATNWIKRESGWIVIESTQKLINLILSPNFRRKGCFPLAPSIRKKRKFLDFLVIVICVWIDS